MWTIWELPDVLLFKIVSYVTAPTHRATIICHSIAPLCRDAYQALILDDDSSAVIWDSVLREDYGVVDHSSSGAHHHQDHHSIGSKKRRRSCSRLRRSPIQRVADAHRLMNDNSEIAYFYLSEMVNCSSSTNKLTKARLVSLLEEYGPYLRINHPVSSGGQYLVEICRAKHVTVSVVLKCIQELVEHRGALVNVQTRESDASQITPLCVAAARGMPAVLHYLLRHGARKDVLSSGRFALHTHPKKSIRCRDQNAQEFAEAMRNAEALAGATPASLASLDSCIRILSNENTGT